MGEGSKDLKNNNNYLIFFYFNQLQNLRSGAGGVLYIFCHQINFKM